MPFGQTGFGFQGIDAGGQFPTVQQSSGGFFDQALDFGRQLLPALLGRPGGPTPFSPPRPAPAPPSVTQDLLALLSQQEQGSPQIGMTPLRNVQCAPEQMFRSGAATTTIRSSGTVIVPHPVTCKPTYWKDQGQPILFRGDLQACKRVERAAKLANKALRKR